MFPEDELSEDETPKTESPPTNCEGYFPPFPPKSVKDNPDLEVSFFINGESRNRIACSLTMSNGVGFHDTVKEIGTSLDTSKPLLIFCHGIGSWRNQMLIWHVAADVSKKLDCHVLRFDFRWSGHSTPRGLGPNKDREQHEVEDLNTVVDFVRTVLKCNVGGVVGHSKGGDCTMTHAVRQENRISTDDRSHLNVVPCYVNISGTFNEDVAKIKNSRLFTIHGTEDKVSNVENAYNIDKVVENHKLEIIDNANHNFQGTRYIDRIGTSITSFIKSCEKND